MPPTVLKSTAAMRPRVIWGYKPDPGEKDATTPDAVPARLLQAMGNLTLAHIPELCNGAWLQSYGYSQ
jgi:hypothetical protein